MAQRPEHQTGGQTLGQAFEKGSGKPRKAGGNPIEGKFGQAKNGYGMNRIRARLKTTSQSWIASIILVLNLVKLAGEALLCLGFSAWKGLEKQIILHLRAIISISEIQNRPAFEVRPVLDELCR